MKQTSYRTGMFAESLCRWWLPLKGCRIVASRYKSTLGEIDIIALRGSQVAMIEVKARSTHDKIAEAILPHQKQKLQRATLDFLARHPQFNSRNLHFDMMLVVQRRFPMHIQDAWRPE